MHLYCFFTFPYFSLNYLWLFTASGNCDKWPNSKQISKLDNFKHSGVNLTDDRADKVLSAQGCCPGFTVVKLLEPSHTKLKVGCCV